MYQTPFKVLLATRLPLLVQIPIRTVIFMLVFDNIQRLPQIMRRLKHKRKPSFLTVFVLKIVRATINRITPMQAGAEEPKRT